MPTFREIRARVFNKMRIRPKRLAEPSEQRTERALTRIRATPEEAKAVIEFAKMARSRLDQRKQYNAKGAIEDDPVFIRLKERADRLLGKDRADEFFGLCNDPYF
jgi:hypothetical protein